jgi:hypothetical protein
VVRRGRRYIVSRNHQEAQKDAPDRVPSTGSRSPPSVKATRPLQARTRCPPMTTRLSTPVSIAAALHCPFSMLARSPSWGVRALRGLARYARSRPRRYHGRPPFRCGLCVGCTDRQRSPQRVPEETITAIRKKHTRGVPPEVVPIIDLRCSSSARIALTMLPSRPSGTFWQ